MKDKRSLSELALRAPRDDWVGGHLEAGRVARGVEPEGPRAQLTQLDPCRAEQTTPPQKKTHTHRAPADRRERGERMVSGKVRARLLRPRPWYLSFYGGGSGDVPAMPYRLR